VARRRVLRGCGASLVAATRTLGPLAKKAGWAAELAILAASAAGNRLARDSPLAPLAGELGEKVRPQPVYIGTLHVLKDLIQHLDSERREKQRVAPPLGGLHPRIVEDGRLLWLCPDHSSAYETK
jgi:hypothetical protein